MRATPREKLLRRVEREEGQQECELAEHTTERNVVALTGYLRDLGFNGISDTTRGREVAVKPDDQLKDKLAMEVAELRVALAAKGFELKEERAEHKVQQEMLEAKVLELKKERAEHKAQLEKFEELAELNTARSTTLGI